jgi:DNA (cytosine-5)-methyltransferase 1
MTFGSLFAGIGGMDLGLERAGMRCAWQVEIDPFCRRVLAKHWPDVRKHDDVRTFPNGDPDGWRVDLICGGFPCQGISRAGRGEGMEHEGSGLWGEFARIIRLLRPRFVVVENSPEITLRGLGRVFIDLAAMRYDAEWAPLAAGDFGLPHERKRTIIVAYPGRERLEKPGREQAAEGPVVFRDRDYTDLDSVRMLRGLSLHDSREARARMRVSPDRGLVVESIPATEGNEAESPVCRVAHGFPGRVDRIRALGNAVVPQVAEWIGKRILESNTCSHGG